MTGQLERDWDCDADPVTGHCTSLTLYSSVILYRDFMVITAGRLGMNERCPVLRLKTPLELLYDTEG